MTQISNKQAPPPAPPAACCSDLENLLSPELFKALSDPTRLSLLAELATSGEARTVSQVAPCCTVDLSVVSRHLSTLRQAGVVKSEKQGREVYYRVRAARLARVLRSLADALEACCPEPCAPENSPDRKSARGTKEGEAR